MALGERAGLFCPSRVALIGKADQAEQEINPLISFIVALRVGAEMDALRSGPATLSCFHSHGSKPSESPPFSPAPPHLF